jgi:hypothetical protein
MASSVRRAIKARGWTPDTVRGACAALATILAERALPGSTVSDDDMERASKLARSLRYAAELDPEELADTLERLGPPCEAPQWDELHAWLVQNQTDAGLLARLKDRYGDPVPHLIAFLNDVAPPPVDMDHDDDNADGPHRRAYRLLFDLGTHESWTYVLSRLDLFSWELEREFDQPIGQHSVAIQSVALELWPTITWRTRADIVLLLHAYRLLDSRFMELLLGVDGQAMASSDRADYLEALGNCFDQRLLPRIHSILKHALDELSHGGTVHDKRTVAAAIWECNKLDAEPPAELRSRVEALGVHWTPRILYGDAVRALGIVR